MIKKLHHKVSESEVLTYEGAANDYRKLYHFAKSIMQKGDGPKMKKAFLLAIEIYKEKQHSSKCTFSSWQPIEIARIVTEEIGLGVVPTICTLLHGLAPKMALKEINNIFGAEITQTLLKLSELDSALQLQEVNYPQNTEALIVSLTQNSKIVLIKLAENLYKMRMLNSLPHNQQLKTVSQVENIFIPIAHRLGLNAIKAELEDLHLKCIHTDTYHAISAQIKKNSEERNRFIHRFIRPIQELLQKTPFPFTITARSKAVSSVQKKMKVLGISFKQVYDIFAIRIILDVPPAKENLACWKAYEAVTSLYKPHPKKFRNWLGYPRRNGYQSLHTTVMSHEGAWVEVQIRTKKMNKRAEKGYAAHWKYKEDNSMKYTLSIDAWLSQIRSLLEPKTSEALIDSVNAHLQIAKIEVFTDNHASKWLPVGSTVLDLAFELGTSSGLRCIGGQVNNKPVACYHTLNHGDQVKIITASTPQAREDWLDFAVTYKTHKAIKKLLRQKQDKIISSGKKLLRKQLMQLHLEWNTEIIKWLLIFFDEEKTETLYYKLGEGSIALRHLEDFLNTLHTAQKHRPPHLMLDSFIPYCQEQEQTLSGIAVRKAIAPQLASFDWDKAAPENKVRD